MSIITTKHGTEIYYKDWGKGPVLTFLHGGPLNADAWDGHVLLLAQNGLRVVAHDLGDDTIVGRSTDSSEVARYIVPHRTKWVAKAVLIAAVPPSMQVRSQPGGAAVGNLQRHSYRHRRRPVAVPQGPGRRVLWGQPAECKSVEGMLDQFWLWSIQAGTKNAYESIKALSETDITEDLKKLDVLTLVLHGADDQIEPVTNSARKTSRLIKGAKEFTIRARLTTLPLPTRSKSIPTCSPLSGADASTTAREDFRP